MGNQLQPVKAGVSPYPGEPPVEWVPQQHIRDRAAAQAMYTLILSATAFQPLRSLWSQCFRLYTNQLLDLTTRGGSRLPTGQASEIVDTYVAEYIVKLFGNRPLCSLIPRGPEDVDKARACEQLLQYDWDYMGARRIWYNILKSVCIYGTGPAKVRWVQKTINVPIPGVGGGKTELQSRLAYRGPWLDFVAPFDSFPDPRSYDIDDHYPKCTISYNSWDHFERLAKNKVYYPEAVKQIKEFKDLPQDIRTLVGDRYYQNEQRSVLGFTQDTRNDPDGILTIEWEGNFRPTATSPPVPSVITVANGVCVRCEPSSFITKENSLIWTVMDEVPGQLFGIGLIQKNMPQLHGAHVALNMALTATADTIRGLRLFKPDAIYNATEIDNPPGGNLLVKRNYDIDKVAKDMQKGRLGADIYQVLGLLMGRAESVNAYSELKSGRVAKGQHTATETDLVFRQIAQRFLLPLMMVEDTGIARASRKMHYLNRQFLDPDFVYRILDRDAMYFPKIAPEDLAIDPDFTPNASQRESNRAMAISRLQNAIKIITPMVSIDPMKYGAILDKFLGRLFEVEQFRDLDDIRRILQVPITPPPALTEGPGGGLNTGRGAPGISNIRRDNRTPSPTNIAELVKSVGGSMGNAVSAA